jgi:hypothetical protein
MWRHHYRPHWLEWGDCLFIILETGNEPPFGLPPVGSRDKEKALDFFFDELRKGDDTPKVCRVSEDFINRFVDPSRYDVYLDRDNSDYVYSTRDLIHLSGRKYHKKKNHLNKFLKHYRFEYRSLDIELVECFLEMQESWCQMRECVENPSLLAEDYAVREALTHFESLAYQGGAIQINKKLEAFSLGEPLNRDTAVIHVEKANPEIQGIYAAINQRVCENAFPDMRYINREQDLGREGLRKAKESYYPHHMVDKYVVVPKR